MTTIKLGGTRMTVKLYFDPTRSLGEMPKLDKVVHLNPEDRIQDILQRSGASSMREWDSRVYEPVVGAQAKTEGPLRDGAEYILYAIDSSLSRVAGYMKLNSWD